MSKRYVEKEAVEEMLENAQIISNGEYCGYCTEDINLELIATADVVEVVRCRECKYWIADDIGRRYCELIDCWTGDRDFCSRGERNELR